MSRRSNSLRRHAPPVGGLLALVLLAAGADGPKQTIEARGLSFQAPASWKSSPPTTQMRLAQLKVDPIEGDDYPAEVVVFAFPGGAGSVEQNLQRWQRMFKDKDGNTPRIESKTVKGKNVDVVRAETSGHYTPAQFGRPEPERPDARLPGANTTPEDVAYFIRMGGPNKTIIKPRPDFDELIPTTQVGGK